MHADEDWAGQRVPVAKGGPGTVDHSTVTGTQQRYWELQEQNLGTLNRS